MARRRPTADRRRQQARGQRLEALAFWLAFGSAVTALWLVLPTAAASTEIESFQPHEP